MAKLDELGLAPAPAAAPNTLFRRLHLDITGLPPSIADAKQFLGEFEVEGDVALSRWIDALMGRPQWGEHRGRYWLDAARYADTHGMHFDNYREMWAYRDWVIRAFNNNQPFDAFTVDQLAGDLLPSPTQDQLIATGFQRCNITTNEGGTIEEENLANYAADRVQTFGWVYLGLTTNCAQCHDHKFDPISAADYYSLSAYFRNTTQGGLDGNSKDGRGPVIKIFDDRQRARLDAIAAEVTQLSSQRDARRERAKPEFDRWLQDVSLADLESPFGDDDVVAPLQKDNLGTAAKAPELTWSDEADRPPAPEIGKDSVITLGDVTLGDVGGLSLAEPFTVSLWVKPKANGGYGSIVAKMDGQNQLRGWDLFQERRELAVHLIDAWPGNALKIRTTGNALRDDRWQHIIVTYDGKAKPDSIAFFVDGKRRGTKVAAQSLKPGATIQNSVPLKIGSRSSGSFFNGWVQDVRIQDGRMDPAKARAEFVKADLRSVLGSDADRGEPALRERIFGNYLEVFDTEYSRLARRTSRLVAERENIERQAPVTHIQRERTDSMPMANILMRGAYDAKGQQVSAAPPAALHDLPEGAPNNRLGLAQWVVDENNPLTARVTVNRFWQEVFGQGIVVTPEDFGVMGAPPTHPELLDWLAVEFQQTGWDVKRLFKTIFMSATYRQAAITTPEKAQHDRDNVFLSRGPRFRMDAEMIRDYALASSGLLVDDMFGPGTKPYQPTGIWDVVGLPGGDTRKYVQDGGDRLYRRSLYTFWKRMAPPPALETLNAPSREVCVVRRERTNTPLQALVTLNDVQFVEAARALATETLRTHDDFEARIAFLFQRLLTRPVIDKEWEILTQARRELADFYAGQPDAAKKLLQVGASAVPEDLDTVELATWTMLCNELLNLDEVLNK